MSRPRRISHLDVIQTVRDCFGEFAPAARKLKVSREYVRQVIEKHGGLRVLNIKHRREFAEESLRIGSMSMSMLAEVTGYSEPYLRILRRKVFREVLEKETGHGTS
jgi:hypothetical protein